MKMLQQNIQARIIITKNNPSIDSFNCEFDATIYCDNCNADHDINYSDDSFQSEVECDCGAIIDVDFNNTPCETDIDIVSVTKIDGEAISKNKNILLKDFQDFRNLLKILAPNKGDRWLTYATYNNKIIMRVASQLRLEKRKIREVKK